VTDPVYTTSQNEDGQWELRRDDIVIYTGTEQQVTDYRKLITQAE